MNTARRWRRFGLSGAKLIWGGEAVAVRPDGRANPNQLCMTATSEAGIAQLRQTLVDAHREATGSDSGLLVGLQLTHSGRFCKPNDSRRFESRIAYRHPVLDRKLGLGGDHPVLSDDESVASWTTTLSRPNGPAVAASISSISSTAMAISATSS